MPRMIDDRLIPARNLAPLTEPGDWYGKIFRDTPARTAGMHPAGADRPRGRAHSR